MIIVQIQLFVTFYLFGLLLNNKEMYENFGFGSRQPAIIGLIVFFQYILSPMNFVLEICMTALTRRFEYQVSSLSSRAVVVVVFVVVVVGSIYGVDMYIRSSYLYPG